MRIPLAVLVVLLVAANNNLIEYLTGDGYPAAVIIFYVGIIAFVITYFFIRFRKRPIRVANPKRLLLRVILDAISIWCMFESFKYLSASSVSIVQRMDIPFLILIAFLRGRKLKSLQFYLSIWTIIILLFFAFDAKFNDEDPIGFVYALAGVILFSLSLLIIKGQTAKESVSTLSLSYFLSSILGGLVFGYAGSNSFQISNEGIALLGIAGIIQVVIVLAGIEFLRLFEAEMARLPYVLGAFATMILEMIVEHKFFNFNQIGLSVIIIGLLTTICLNPKSPRNLKWSRQLRAKESENKT